MAALRAACGPCRNVSVVSVDLETPWGRIHTPIQGRTNTIDGSVAASIAATPPPHGLPGTLLERSDAALGDTRGRRASARKEPL